jgi:hypothetical protein
MILVAVRRLHEHEIRVLERDWIAMERRVARTDVAREHDHLLPASFVEGELETRRSEDVPCFNRTHANARRNHSWLVVSERSIQRMQPVHFLLRVQRLDERFARL